MKIDTLSVEGVVIAVQGDKVLVFEGYPSVCVPGEEVSMVTDVLKPKDFLTDTGRVFQYQAYLRQKGIYAIVFIDDVSCRGKASSFMPFSLLRTSFHERTLLSVTNPRGVIAWWLIAWIARSPFR